MLNKNSITFKAVSLFLIISAVILALVNSYSYFSSSRIVIKMAEENSMLQGEKLANEIALQIKPVEDAVKNLALALENPDLTTATIIEYTRQIIERNTTIYGSTISFEPYSAVPDSLYFAPYSYRTDDGIKTTFFGDSAYRYFTFDWYLLPKLLGKAVWTEPYFDTGGGNVLMTTFTAPFYHQKNGEKVFAGVVTADISLEWIQKLFGSLKIYETGYSVLLSRSGYFIYHPTEDLIMNETIFSLSEFLNDKQLGEIGQEIKEGKSGFISRTSYHNKKESFLYFTPIPIGDWSLLFFYPKDEVLGEITDLAYHSLFIDISGFLTLAIAIILLTKKFTSPLIELAKAAGKIATGNLDTEVPPKTSDDELGMLTQSFTDMQTSLKDYITELTETTSHKERIESELRIARDIQMGILPKLFPAFPEKSEFDIYAMIEPAREIGGDLYDFFFIDDHKFCFLIGDVSGKGVPAAFFMAVTKTLLKVISEQSPDPASILYKVNNDLAADNDSCMFVTLFLGILDIRNGELRIGNAGHNAPIILSKDKIDYLPSANEPLAGAMEDMEYSTTLLQLQKGDQLFLYTDGVTEAMNRSDELFSEERLLNEMRDGINTDRTPQNIVQHIEASVKKFADGAEQSDDITMLCIEYNGCE